MSLGLGLLLLACGGLGALGAAVYRAGARPDPGRPADLIVVPGCRVREDGSPSACLARRTEAAVALWREGRAPRLAVSGGAEPGRPSEGAVAAALARSLGVPDDALVVETSATSTWENAALVAAAAPGARMIVVTDGWHALRCGRVFRHHAVDVQVVGLDRPASWRTWARELGVLLVYGARGRL